MERKHIIRDVLGYSYLLDSIWYVPRAGAVEVHLMEFLEMTLMTREVEKSYLLGTNTKRNRLNQIYTTRRIILLHSGNGNSPSNACICESNAYKTLTTLAASVNQYL